MQDLGQEVRGTDAITPIPGAGLKFIFIVVLFILFFRISYFVQEIC